MSNPLLSDFGKECRKSEYHVHNTNSGLIGLADRWSKMPNDDRRALHTAMQQLAAAIDLLKNVEIICERYADLDEEKHSIFQNIIDNQ